MINNRVHSGEDGIFLPAAAVVFLMVSTFFVVLSINTHIVRRAHSQLSLNADKICNSLTEGNLAVQATTVRTFRNFVRSLPPIQPEGFVTITASQLVEPTYPPGDVNLYTETNPNLSAYLEGNFNNYQGVSLSSLGLGGCNDCSYRSNASHAPYKGPGGGFTRYEFPKTFWNNLENAGNSIACQFTADVRQIWRKPVQIRVVSATWKRFRGDWDRYISFSQDPSSALARANAAPRLIIGISTHMTTDAVDDRFRFPAPVPTGSLETSGGSSAYVPGNGFFKGRPTLVPYNGDWHQLSKVHTKPKLDDEGNEVLDENGKVVQEYDYTEYYYEVNTSYKSATEQLTRACQNPAVLARNAYASTFIELASRSGHLRWSTEVYNVGTKDFSIPNDESKSTASFPSEKIIRFKEDLVKKRYFIPLVKFNYEYPAGISHSVPSGPSETEAHQQYAQLLANQLRHCFHMYASNYFGSSPISRFNPEREFSLRNEKYEDSDYRQGTTIPRSGFGSFWEQQGSEPLSAAQVVSVLGTTQICPHRAKREFAELTINDERVCVKPAIDGESGGITRDLKPDLLGFMKAASSTPNSSVILLTHQGVDSAEKSAIRSEANKILGRVFVIFIPFREDEASHTEGVNDALNSLREAFDAPLNGNSKNRVFAVLPDRSGRVSASSLATFWSQELLSPQDEEQYIVHRAMDMFSRGLLEAERRL